MMDMKAVQTALFSATYDAKVLEFAGKIIANPEVVTVKTEELSLDTIYQYYVMTANDEEKIRALRSFYGTITVDNAIVFCRVRDHPQNDVSQGVGGGGVRKRWRSNIGGRGLKPNVWDHFGRLADRWRGEVRVGFFSFFARLFDFFL